MFGLTFTSLNFFFSSREFCFAVRGLFVCSPGLFVFYEWTKKNHSFRLSYHTGKSVSSLPRSITISQLFCGKLFWCPQFVSHGAKVMVRSVPACNNEERWRFQLCNCEVYLCSNKLLEMSIHRTGLHGYVTAQKFP